MIIGTDWAWGHVPKTGGDFTSQLIESVGIPYLRSDPRYKYRPKHDSFYSRGVQTKRYLLANLRHLPAAVISRYQERAQRGPRRVPLPRTETMVNIEPDCILRRLGADVLPIVWLRSEHIVEDLIAVFDTIEGLTPGQKQQMRAVQAEKPPLKYDHNVERWFSRKQVDRLFNLNPLWAEIEQRIYAPDYDPAAAIAERAPRAA